MLHATCMLVHAPIEQGALHIHSRWVSLGRAVVAALLWQRRVWVVLHGVVGTSRADAGHQCIYP